MTDELKERLEALKKGDSHEVEEPVQEVPEPETDQPVEEIQEPAPQEEPEEEGRDLEALGLIVQRTEVVTVKHPLLGFIKWIAKAMGGEYLYLSMIHFEDNNIIATDGRRLHLYFDEDLTLEGDFDVIKNDRDGVILIKTEEYRFPNWQRVIPLDTTVLGTIDLRVKKKEMNRPMFTLSKWGYLLNEAYVADLIGYEWEVSKQTDDDDGTKSLVFKCGSMTAVIMPMQQ
jgi:hypothetical protein